ncbi:hypothetical protein Pint_26256 [Pistacia integerrima]|uniref:Uncharacterized protein n=1 Tax=Pistacia integerrima TaxID=434235 RepID=A0ACC0YEC4_9ROSI|nr:hypothetical protein Pint_26256 [Pistacia integerrima]
MEDQRGEETHILTIPFPAQGHINPMLQLSKRLASKGLKVTLVTAESTPISIQGESLTSSIKIESIPDGFSVDAGVNVINFDEYIERFKDLASDGAPFFTQARRLMQFIIIFIKGHRKFLRRRIFGVIAFDAAAWD